MAFPRPIGSPKISSTILDYNLVAMTYVIALNGYLSARMGQKSILINDCWS